MSSYSKVHYYCSKCQTDKKEKVCLIFTTIITSKSYYKLLKNMSVNNYNE